MSLWGFSRHTITLYINQKDRITFKKKLVNRNIIENNLSDVLKK